MDVDLPEDREIELVHDLLEKIMPFHDSMINACDVCAELDCLLAFAEAARTFDYRRPQMIDGSIIDVVQARHPLQELVVDAFVPNDAHLVGGVGLGQPYEPIHDSNAANDSNLNSIVLCTGANACGKSVYLKQVALIQYMAQVGSFVPAESATLGIVDKIFTRIQTRESVSKVLYTVSNAFPASSQFCSGSIGFYDRPQPGLPGPKKLHFEVSHTS